MNIVTGMVWENGNRDTTFIYNIQQISHMLYKRKSKVKVFQNDKLNLRINNVIHHYLHGNTVSLEITKQKLIYQYITFSILTIKK